MTRDALPRTARRSTRLGRRPLDAELLEDRITPAGLIDWAEPNNTLAQAPYPGRGGNLT